MSTTLASPTALKKVLVVEDKSMYHGLYNLEFGHDYNLTILKDASEANVLLGQPGGAPFDVCVLDLKIPRTLGTIDRVEYGFDLIERVMNRWPGVPVFVTSSVEITEQDSRRFENLKIAKSRIYRKPFLLRDLHAAIDEAITGDETE